MKKFLLILLTLTTLPFSTSYCEWNKDDRNLAIGAATVATIVGGFFTYRWYNQGNPATPTNKNPSQHIVTPVDPQHNVKLQKNELSPEKPQPLTMEANAILKQEEAHNTKEVELKEKLEPKKNSVNELNEATSSKSLDIKFVVNSDLKRTLCDSLNKVDKVFRKNLDILEG
ncbi:MAG TPA: hypothetical protein VJ201_08170 [Candidatus Babeliales bacterium]|nr:hypothetical protein [Candidatus Babeliales bacterium]HLC07519.1 hypothetical protein [Candidatus Babeliales bacterium]